MVSALFMISASWAQEKSVQDTGGQELDQDQLYSAGQPKSTEAQYNIIWKHDWENNQLGAYDRATWIEDWSPRPVWRDSEDARKEDIYIIEDPLTNSKCLEMTYVKGSVGTYTTWTCSAEPELRPGGGEYWTGMITDGPGYDEVYFSYNVMFKPGFDFVKGGKLPFVAGGPPDDQAATKPGYYDGFDCILMFRTDESDGRTTGRIQYYIYHQNNPDPRYAESREWAKDGVPFVFDVSELRWYNITVRVKVNSWTNGEGNTDGFIEGFVDGKFIMGMYNLEFLSGYNQGKGVDRMGIASFFGGCQNSHGAKRDEWSLYDDFVVWTYADGENVPRGHTRSDPDRVLEIPNPKTDDPVIIDPPEPDPIEAPQNLQLVKAGGSTLSISWEHSGSTPAETYKIYLNGNEYVSFAGKSFTIGGLTSNTPFVINVSAIDAEGIESPLSADLQASTLEPDTEAPSIPTNLRLDRANEFSLTVSWDEATDNVEVSGYNVYFNGEFQGTIVGTTFTKVNLPPSTNYQIEVSAVDPDRNESARSSPPLQASTLAPDEEAPTQPTNLEVTLATQNSIAFTWTESEDNRGVEGYKLFVNGLQQGTVTGSSHTLTGLTPGFPYTIVLRAFDEIGNESANSLPLNTQTQNPDVGVASIELPSVQLVDVLGDNPQEEKAALSSIASHGFAELIEYGVTLKQTLDPNETVNSFDSDITSDRGTLYLIQKETSIDQGDRVTFGLQAMYNFSAGTGSIIYDQSDPENPTDLELKSPADANWIKGQGMEIGANPQLTSFEASSKLVDALKETNEISLEAWVRCAGINQAGAIVSLSQDAGTRVAMLGQVGNSLSFDYAAMLNTSPTRSDGWPQVQSNRQLQSINLHHVVYTRDYLGNEHIYINGKQAYSGVREGDFSSLGEGVYISIGNELSGMVPWQGNIYLMAIYNKALFPEEVIKNFAAGIGRINYTSDLPIEPNVFYELQPFALTDQGMVLGEVRNVFIENVLYAENEDSISMQIYPNPSSGNFYIHVSCVSREVKRAYLRVADLMGRVYLNQELKELPDFCREAAIIQSPGAGGINSSEGMDFEVNLGDALHEGIYNLMLIVDNNAIARRLVIQK